MRIALVAQEYPPETAKGGIGSQTYLKAHGLAARGHRVHVISRSTTGQRIDRWDGPVRLTRVPGLDRRMPVHTEVADWLGYSTEVATTLAELHAADPFDLAEFPEWAAEAYVHLLNRTQWNNLRTVIHLHGPLVMLAHTLGWPVLNSEFYRSGTALEGTCLRLADAVFSSSHCSADWVARHYGLDRASIPVLHTGIDTNLFSPRIIPKEDRPTILFVGKLARSKGVLTLVKAAVRLAHEIPRLQLRLAGRGEDSILKEIRHLASSSPSDLLDLPGFVPREALPDHFARAHVFAAPSVYEGGPGFVYLEAMACGLPVIACHGSGAAEVVLPLQTGLLIPPDDVAALSEALLQFLSDPAACHAIGQRALQWVLKHADSVECVERLEAFYFSVLKQRSG